jgi:hypothetical protein
MSNQEASVTCPHCDKQFNVADRLRAHIEAEVRNDIHEKAEKAAAEFKKTLEKELKSKLDSHRLDSKREQAILEKRLSKQAKDLTGLRETKLELTELKGTIDVEVKEARAKAVTEARKKFEDEIEGLVDKRVEEESEKQKVLEQQITQQRKELNGLRKHKIELADLKETREIELEEAKAEAARQAKRQLNQELDERINERLKEETSDKELKIGKLELQLQRQNTKIQELEEQRTASHGELEGEVLELAVEDTLRNLFPRDGVNEVKRGAYGADIEHSVPSPSGTVAGKILWECKKHKRWNDGWVATIRKNAIEYGADTMVIVTSTMPDGMESFGMVDDVFVCRYHEVSVVSALLRYAVLRASGERAREQHMMTTQERVLEYVSGPEFAMVMKGVMQAYEEFEDDLRKEEQYMKTRWKARRGYLRNVIDSVTSMMGRLEHLGAGDFEVMDEIDGSAPSGFLVVEIIEEEE